MRQSKALTITLPQKMADEVKARVASGDYASESEVIREGLRALAVQEEALEHWLKTEGPKRFAAYKTNPDASLAPKDMRARMKAYAKKKAKA